MDYAQTVSYLYHAAPAFSNVGAGAYKEGLSNTMALDIHFGHPHQHFRTLHVAGTNGKGSVSSTLAAILQSSGLKVGLYTSPHLVDFRERIRVNSEMIPEQRVIDFVEQERAFFEPLYPSFFELTTALAFKFFAEQEVDVAVVEVGLGGRLDCTNIIRPDLSIITNISFDHQQFLGDTLALIAGEKAGIIKTGVPVVIGETNGHDDVREVFLRAAKSKGAIIRFADEEQLPEVECELKGDYQRANMLTVQCALDELRKQRSYRDLLTDEAIAYGLMHVTELTGLQGRWQKLRERPTMVCDAGHNAAGIAYVVRQLEAQPNARLRIVFGMVNDKDYQFALSELERLQERATYYFTQPSCKRALPAAELAAPYLAKNLPVRTFATVQAAVQAALADAAPDDFIFVGGSCYVVADLLSAPTAVSAIASHRHK
ncbi:MAG: bifunctional folylpolyglutamate synthase/dihydrofolate synthase [Bacteroidaceae bacterium]|nr:bifunctional folylpolyglutamate synthase/dihydrofolate synthase [Bacteroidaceae bacterium]